jgi:hypothetical protein
MEGSNVAVECLEQVKESTLTTQEPLVLGSYRAANPGEGGQEECCQVFWNSADGNLPWPCHGLGEGIGPFQEGQRDKPLAKDLGRGPSPQLSTTWQLPL